VQGYLAEPKDGAAGAGDGRHPGVVGPERPDQGRRDKLAAAGYRALVPDLYRGKLALAVNEAEHLMTNLNFGDAAGQDVRGAVQHLKRAAARRPASPDSAWAGR
jgi:carboxymethylenebutenolidase